MCDRSKGQRVPVGSCRLLYAFKNVSVSHVNSERDLGTEISTLRVQLDITQLKIKCILSKREITVWRSVSHTRWHIGADRGRLSWLCGICDDMIHGGFVLDLVLRIVLMLVEGGIDGNDEEKWQLPLYGWESGDSSAAGWSPRLPFEGQMNEWMNGETPRSSFQAECFQYAVMSSVKTVCEM